jgi:type IV pilus assembly protein PilB
MALIQELTKRGLLKKEEALNLEFEAKQTGLREEEVILKAKILPEIKIFQIKSELLGIPLKEFYPEDVPAEVLDIIPEDSAKHYQMVPLARRENFVEIGMSYPEDLKAQEALQFLAREHNFDYKVFLITLSDLKAVLNRYRSLRGEVKRALSELEMEIGKETGWETIEETGELEKFVEEAPITKVVAVILRHAVEGRASDVHIEPTRNRTKVRFRVDGILYSSLFLPSRIHPAIVARIKIMANLKIDELRLPQDGRFTIKIGDRDIDFRVSTFPTAMGEKVALRILDPTMGRKTFEELGLAGRNLKVIQELTKKPYGMILATGPTGSGKTTTLYALLNALNRDSVNIVTVEDPIEYFIEGINQSRVRPEIGYDFSTALRHILRQDPDIIMVGEIRDQETAALAIHAALTGHIMLSSLHTNNAIGTIPRLIDMGIEPFLIPPSLLAVISQRLVRSLCPYCKVPKKPTSEIKDFIRNELLSLPSSILKESGLQIEDFSIFEARGCRRCNFKGYLGRIGIFEILVMNDRLAELVRKKPSERELEKEASRQGMLTMRQDGIIKALKGITSLEEVSQATKED